jgi:acetate kinase
VRRLAKRRLRQRVKQDGRAGLAENPLDYRFSSAATRYALDLDMLDNVVFWE